MKKIGIFALVTAPILAYSGVNLKNGNYYTSFTDLVAPGSGQKLEITRTYNSKATEVGWFGFGWGSDYETTLSASTDGCVVIHENGAGAKTRFCPKTAVDVEAASVKIVEAMKKKTPMTGQAEKQLLEKLKTNSELRHAYAKNFGIETKIASGTVLYSNDRGMQELKKTKDGYERKYHDGKVEAFTDFGKISWIKDKNGYSVNFQYSKAGLLESIKDSLAKQVFFTWYPEGQVKEVWSQSEKKSFFKYEGQNLVYSKDVGGNEYGFEYDKNHNLTKIIYNPSRAKGEKEDFMAMTYEPKTLFVSSVQERNGETTKYEYGSNPKMPDDHYWTSVTKDGFDGKPVTNKYEYEIKTKPDGSRYTYRIVTEINGLKTETIYTECCSLPQKIARGNQVTSFEYNAKGLLTKKVSGKEIIQIGYDDKCDKINEVKNGQGWTKFKYDPKCNLLQAQNSGGKAVLLYYDRNGKISMMLDKDEKTKEQRKLSFKYNSQGKPVEIAMDKVGKINVVYDNYGEIKKVESDKGHKMALQVTQAFQNLLTIVKPAGVNLNM